MIIADARHLPISSGTVQCCVTSPPYWGLRDYGVPASAWGGDPGCEHEWGSVERTAWANAVKGPNNQGKNGAEYANQTKEHGNWCQHCGAWRGCLGLEPTPYLFVEHLVEVFREVRRVLRDDGVLWLNLGDSYATGAGKVGEHPGGGEQGSRWAGRGVHTTDNSGKHAPRIAALGPMIQPNRLPVEGLKPKDLCMVPARVAIALQEDGWFLRSDTIWAKPNCMPESVTDRPTRSHEYVFLLAKAERYFYDHEAIKNPPAVSTLRQIQSEYEGLPLKDYAGAGVQNASDVKARIVKRLRDKQRGHSRRHAGFNERWDQMTVAEQRALGSNARSVWTISPQPFQGAHFATMPEELAERCVLAGSRPGDLVFDPFLGSGTTARVAISLGRRAIGCDLQRGYLPLQRERMQVTRGLPLEMGETA